MKGATGVSVIIECCLRGLDGRCSLDDHVTTPLEFRIFTSFCPFLSTVLFLPPVQVSK